MKRLVLLAALVSGCAPSLSPPYLTLIDQRTFSGTPVAPQAADVKALPALPLAIIRFDQPDYDYAPDLARAVDLALSRKPDAEFNVVSPVARGTVPSAQVGQDAANVARSIAEQSVPPERIHVGLIEDSGTPLREVRVFVR